MAATGYSATVKGGLFETVGVTTLTAMQGKSPLRRRISENFGKKSLLATRQKMRTLMGAAAGATATKTLGRIEANVELGGKRTVETETLINVATDAADITEINADFLAETSQTTFGSSPPANLDGNPLGFR